MDWQDVDQNVQVLASKIDQKPYIIIAIVRGGLIPARLLAKYLEVKEMYALTIKKQGNDRKVISSIDQDLTGKNVLIVEDVLETGTSLIVAKEYIESIGGIAKTASLFIQPDTKIIPDYYVETKQEVPIFPWD
ncbi:MAG: phosphoribosyltransferase family protein [Patescibacteria group bacterium]